MNFRQIALDLPIKRKLFYGILATCTAALALACAALFWFQSAQFRHSFAAELDSLGAIIASNSAAPLAFDDRKSAREVLNSLRFKPHITSARIFDGEGRLFASMGTAAPRPPTATPETAPAVSEVRFAEDYATLVLPIKLEGGRSGRFELRAYFADQYRTLISLYATVLAGVLVAALVVILLMSSALQRLIAAPIIALADVARNIGRNEDYSTRAIEHGRDEVGLLTRTFNRMLEQIQSRDRRLHEIQQRYEVAVMGSSDGLWDWDLVTDEVYLSPRWKSMLGYADAEMPNSLETFHRLVHPDDIAQVQARAEAYLRGGVPIYEVEFRGRHKDDSYRWILTRGAASRNEQGVPVRFAGSHTDITERRKNEEQIRLARERFESLVNSIHGIVWEADPASFRMLFVSDYVLPLLGQRPLHWLEHASAWTEAIHPEDRAAIGEARRQGLAQGQHYQLEYRMTAADGRIVWLRENVAVEREGDRPVRLRAVAIDITAEKQSAEQIGRMQRELVDASRQAGMAEVATGVLHNVGNVLNSVNVSATLIVEQLHTSKTTRLAEAVKLLQQRPAEEIGDFLAHDPKGKRLVPYLGAVSKVLLDEQALLTHECRSLHANIDHIKQIVTMQQTYAKTSGAREILPVAELLEDALRMTSVTLTNHAIELVRDFETVPPVLVDRHKVLQIFVNLLTNAKEALSGRDEGRRIVLRIRPGAGSEVRIEASDNGSGIARENLARIFGHGFTTKKSGHGFGLHSGANAAREMGGSLSGHSEGPGTGATFILELPVAKLPPSAARPVVATAALVAT